MVTSTPRKRRPRALVEYRFKIDAYSPETMPMSRLARYALELAEVLGEPAAVHLMRVDPGSTVLVQKIDYEAVPKIKERVIGLRRGEAPRDAARAYAAINKLLREDNAVGFLRERKAGAVLLRFPGREEPEEKYPAIREYGSIDGEVIRIGGADETVHVVLESEGRQISGCWCDRSIGKELGHKLFEPVRLFGRGRWLRDSDGNWTLDNFKIEHFESLRDTPLSAAVESVQKIPVEWSEDAYSELKLIRHGPGGKGRNGGH
jgi:hypothetical protein